MARTESTALTITPREPAGSRQARRLRRQGNVPGVLYGGGDEPLSFQVPARTLRQALAHAGAVLDVTIEGGSSSPAVLKDLASHPVSGETLHVDLLRVRLDEKIQSTVVLELTGTEDAPGIRDGGVLEQVTRELTIEALPGEIPDVLTHDVSELQIGDTLTVDAVRPPAGVTLIDDPETVVATLTPPRLQVESADEIEEETAVVGEAPEASAEGDAGEAPAESDSE
jgi:large subunit ribosomal protein L25